VSVNESPDSVHRSEFCRYRGSDPTTAARDTIQVHDGSRIGDDLCTQSEVFVLIQSKRMQSAIWHFDRDRSFVRLSLRCS
jgi:hypothetical protein